MGTAQEQMSIQLRSCVVRFDPTEATMKILAEILKGT